MSSRSSPSSIPRSRTRRIGSVKARSAACGVGLHALAHEHGVAVADREHGADDPSDRLLDADRFEAGVGETARELVECLRGERGEQRLAAGVVAVEGGAADAGSAGEVGHARVTVLGEQASRRLEDRGRRAQAIV